MSMQSAGIIIIDEEILQHQKCDSVSKFLIKELTSLQYTITKVTVIPDNERLIFYELGSLIKNCDIIIAVSEKCQTIFRGIGRMISQEFKLNQDLVDFFQRTGKPYDNNDVFLPVQAKVMHNHVYPVIYFQRIFILKERYAKQSFDVLLKNHLLHYREPRRFEKILRISRNGNAIQDLSEINKISTNGLDVDFLKSDQFFTIKVSSTLLSTVVEFVETVEEKFDSYRLRLVDNNDIWDQVYSSEDGCIRQAIENIQECLKQYGLDNIFMCFNGGKDCTVLLHLVLTVIRKTYPNYTHPIFCMYVQSEKPFLEQDEFINQAKCYYNLKVFTIRSGIKEALQQTLQKFPNYKACFMGTRRTDPYSSDLNVFQMTDANWPQIMRVSPLLDWHYSDIWDYLLYYKVPYCKLYDMGFTSLGNTGNTKKNPSLVYYDEFEEKEVVLPAYKLLKEEKERNGRNLS